MRPAPVSRPSLTSPRLAARLCLSALWIGCAEQAGDSADTGAPPLDTTDTAPDSVDSVDSSDTGDSSDTAEAIDDGDPPSDPEIPLAGCTQSGLGTDDDTLVYVYDYDGQRISTVFVNAASPGPNYSEAWVWDDGHITLDSYDDGGDGVLDTIDAYDWDGDELTLWSHDDDADGLLEGNNDSVYTLLYADVLVEMHRDDENDGTVDAVYVYSYDTSTDPAGVLNGMTVDEGVDGTIDTRVTRSTVANDEGETITQTTTDEGDDGIPELVELTIVDSTGRPTYAEEDSDGNGALDWTYTWFYGDDSTLISVTLVAWSMTGDEDYSVVTSYDYDEWGRHWRWTIDASYASEYVWMWTWSCPG